MPEGVGYSNRSDLMDTSRSPGQAPASQQGQAAARQRQQQALPPMERPSVLGPTRRPSEPVQAGLPVGPGPTAHSLPGRRDQAMARLQGLVADSRDPQLAVLVGRLNASARSGEVPVNRGRRSTMGRRYDMGRNSPAPIRPELSPHEEPIPPRPSRPSDRGSLSSPRADAAMEALGSTTAPPTLRDVGRGRTETQV
jgi:hypothetical protein